MKVGGGDFVSSRQRSGRNVSQRASCGLRARLRLSTQLSRCIGRRLGKDAAFVLLNGPHIFPSPRAVLSPFPTTDTSSFTKRRPPGTTVTLVCHISPDLLLWAPIKPHQAINHFGASSTGTLPTIAMEAPPPPVGAPSEPTSMPLSLDAPPLPVGAPMEAGASTSSRAPLLAEERVRRGSSLRRRSSFSVADGTEALRSTAVVLASSQIGSGSSGTRPPFFVRRLRTVPFHSLNSPSSGLYTGTAYAVANPVDRQRYVLKRVPLPPGSPDTEATCNEARLHARLYHPAIVRYHWGWIEEDHGTGGKALCILLEKCVKELWSCFEGNKSLPRKERARLSLQIMAGLAAIHAEKIVHRDISPW